MAIIDDEYASSRLGDDNLARRFNDYCHASSDWIWEIDATGKFIFSSERCHDFFNVPPLAIVGTNISLWGQFVDADGNKITPDMSAPFSSQLFMTSGHEGSAKVLEVSGRPLTDRKTGTFIGVLGICKDITRQHLAEQSLRAANEELEQKIAERTQSLLDTNEKLAQEVKYHSETKKQLNESLKLFQAIAETSPVAMFISNTDDQTIRFSNDEASTLLGLNPKTLVGKKITDLFFDPQNRRVVRQLVDSARSEGVHQVRYKTADGLMKWGQLSTHPMRIDSQPVLLTAVMDISELKNADRQLAHRSRLATLGELSASIVHEINQPLSIMGMAIETALEAAGAGDQLDDPKTVRAKLMALLQQQQRLIKISDQMRGYSRNKQPDAEWFSANQSCEYVISFLSQDFERRGIRFDVQLPDEHYLIFGVPTALEQVFMNVLSNARDAVEESLEQPSDDSGWIRFNTALNAEKTEVEFRIWNSGPAIPNDLFEKVFMPFVSTKDNESGTGLGLSISKRLIAGMAGTIDAENVIDGVVFKICLPCKSRDAALSEQGAAERIDMPAAPPAGTPNKRPGSRDDKPRRLLIVDDEPALLETMKSFMNDAGYSVETASNGEEALEKVGAHDFDMIITDLQMPKMDGFQFVKTIRGQGNAVPIIVASSLSSSVDNKLAAWDGIEMMSKPMNYDELLLAIKKSEA